MKASSLFSRLRAIAAKSPFTPVCQVSTRSAGAFFVFALAVLVAGTSQSTASAQSVTYAGSGAVNFGTANVCPAGKTTPAPCSKTLTLTYDVTESGTLGTPQALTTGAPNLDYKVASGSTCIGSVTKGNTCKVNVTFAPTAPGARNGAIEIVDGSGNVLATTYIYGIAAAPLASFSPPGRRTINLSTEWYPVAIVIDGNGNQFISGYNIHATGVVEEALAVDGVVPHDPVVKILVTEFPYFGSPLSIDGAGNVFFIGVSENTGNSEVQEILAAGGYTTIQTIATLPNAGGIAVDGSGNLFVGESASPSSNPSTLEEIFAAGGYTTSKTLGGGFPFISVYSIAVDASGNVFVADPYYADGASTGAIFELAATGDYNTVRTIHVSGSERIYPSSVVVSAAGNLFVPIDITGKDGLTSETVEVLAVEGVVPSNPTILSVSPSVSSPALDAQGNLYLPASTGEYYGAVTELQFSEPPPLSFVTASVSHTSSDSPKSIAVQNQGNAALDFYSLSASPNWDIVSGSGTPENCAVGLSLAPSTMCNLSISFEPTEEGSLTGTLDVQDNSLNLIGSTQVGILTGTATTLPYINSLNTTFAAPYSVVIVNGINFGATQGASTVTFNGIATPHYHWSDTQIYVTVPPNATAGKLVVNVGGKTSNAIPFTVVPQPTVTGISPASGPAGTIVTISGTNLDNYYNAGAVSFNGTSLQLLSESNTAITVAVPAGATTGHFHVLVNDTGINTPTFTVTK